MQRSAPRPSPTAFGSREWGRSAARLTSRAKAAGGFAAPPAPAFRLAVRQREAASVADEFHVAGVGVRPPPARGDGHAANHARLAEVVLAGCAGLLLLGRRAQDISWL